MTKKIILLIILFFGLAAGNFVSAEKLQPEITISPDSYLAGEETFYLQGIAEPNTQFYIFLKDDKGNEVKKWPIQSNSNGDWSFASKELIKAGQYNFFVGVQEEKGMIFSEGKPVNISLSGIFFFGFGISFKNLIFVLAAILVFSFTVFWTFDLKLKKAKRKMRKEVKEARNICNIVFENLQEKIKKRIELIDNQPGFNLEEKKAFDDLSKFLNAACSSIEKEIEDVEKLIK